MEKKWFRLSICCSIEKWKDTVHVSGQIKEHES